MTLTLCSEVCYTMDIRGRRTGLETRAPHCS